MNTPETTTLDPFTAEIIRSYLVSTVREMVLTTTRTAFSTCFCHGEDFTCAMFDRDGVMIAQDQGVTIRIIGAPTRQMSLCADLFFIAENWSDSPQIEVTGRMLAVWPQVAGLALPRM